MIRAAAVQRGRTGPTQRFSKSREPDPVVERLLLDVLDPTIHPSRLLQLMFDRTRVMQFACLFGGGVGFLTCPSVVPSDLEDPVVVASLSDEIGQAIPVFLIPVHVFGLGRGCNCLVALYASDKPRPNRSSTP